jgi:hypothetical protein
MFMAGWCALALLGSSIGSTAADAQGRPAKLLLTIVDQTGAVIPDAVVTVTRAGDPAKNVIGPVKSNATGLATLDGLTPGVYLIQTEFPGFEPRVMKDIRLRAGDNKQVAILAIQNLQDEITVGRDRQAAAADPKSTFGTALTREQIEALSDDPDEMRRQIMDMAPDAVLRIDSFEGGQLPPKAQIKSIHVTRDQYAARATTPAPISSTSSRSREWDRCAAAPTSASAAGRSTPATRRPTSRVPSSPATTASISAAP